jgi:hypothetical protein
VTGQAKSDDGQFGTACATEESHLGSVAFTCGSTPDWWYWKPGHTVLWTAFIGGEDVRRSAEVEVLVASRSELVGNTLMTADEWLDESRTLWLRDHPGFQPAPCDLSMVPTKRPNSATVSEPTSELRQLELGVQPESTRDAVYAADSDQRPT